MRLQLLVGLSIALPVGTLSAKHPLAAPGVTSLTNRSVVYRVPGAHSVTLQRAGITAVIVDNEAVDEAPLSGHRAGYNGVASLTHESRPDRNLFVPSYAGLNLEHIHDGTTVGLTEKFEPRKFPMELRVVNPHTVEVYQAPTGNWKLESCGRYELLDDGTIEYTFECIPRAGGYRRGYIGLFWASYINGPQDRAIYFRGHSANGPPETDWIRAVTPSHGVQSTHRQSGAAALPPVDSDFPLSLVNHPSDWVYTKPYYYGISNGMALVQMFRAQDKIWFAQSPTGGGNGNPAWDFQWFIHDYKIDEAYGFVMRAAYVPMDRQRITELVKRRMP